MAQAHFIGIGGVGMNGLAQLAVAHGYHVSGSDRAFDPKASPYSELISQGIQIYKQDGSAITEKTDLVVFSTAIESDNPDLLKAHSLAIPLYHRAALLKTLVADHTLIAVAGTAGKTTTTGLLGWIFDQLGLDPTVYNGAAVLNWKSASTPGNVRRGDGSLWIIEADESDKSLLQFSPTHSIITNISKDHFELEELHRLFDQFEAQTLGTTIRPEYDNIPTGATVDSFVIGGVEFQSPLLGRHNRENAIAAVLLCHQLQCDLEKVRVALSHFQGIERRLEKRGPVNGLTIYDDYAHNPAKMEAALNAVTEQAAPLLAYWRPHGYAPLAQCQQELKAVFANHFTTRNHLFILPVFYAGGTVKKQLTSSDFVNDLLQAGIRAEYVPDYNHLERRLNELAGPQTTILGMGARDPHLPIFANKLTQSWNPFKK
jgi:UDP-N-acetylmuramate--alanine ligase